MKMVNVTIRRSPMMELPLTVGEHEVPVLQAVHGDSGVTVVGSAPDAHTPDAGMEYDRLRRQYGMDRDRNQTYAEIVYGRGPAQLEAALDKSDKASRPVVTHEPLDATGMFTQGAA